MDTTDRSVPYDAVPRDPRDALAELGTILLAGQTLTSVLTRVVELARTTIPGVVEASVTTVRGERISTVVFTGPLAVDLDERQYEAGAGPCIAAARTGATVVIADTATSLDYPEFSRIAARRGITAVLSMGLPVAGRTVGALNLYGAVAFDGWAWEVAEDFARHAAVAVANAGSYAGATETAAQLERALASRAVIEQAKGMLMDRHRLSADDAFAALVRESQHRNRKLTEIAREIVDQAQRPPVAG